MTFAELMQLGSKAVSLAGDAAEAAATLKRNYDAVRGTLSEPEQSQLNARLSEIHAANMRLSSEIDAAAAEAEKR